MSVFAKLQASFLGARYPCLQAVQNANKAELPRGVKVLVLHIEGDVRFWFYRAWPEERQDFVAEVASDEVAKLSDEDICLFLSELLSVDDEHADRMNRKVDSTARAGHIRKLADMEPASSLCIWNNGTDRFVR